MKPTTMLFRNLMAMDVEECIRAYPLDGVVLLSGCDKTTPAHADGRGLAPTCRRSWSPAGPMLARHAGDGEEHRLGHRHLALLGRAARRPAHRGGVLRDRGVPLALGRALHGDGHRLARWPSMAEALGMTLPGNAAIPAPDSRRMALAEMTGRRIVEMVREDLKPVADPDARGLRERDPRRTWPSAARPTRSSTCSPSRAALGVDLALARFDELSRTTPLLRQRAAVGQVPDGGLLLRGRRCRRC